MKTTKKCIVMLLTLAVILSTFQLSISANALMTTSSVPTSEQNSSTPEDELLTTEGSTLEDETLIMEGSTLEDETLIMDSSTLENETLITDSSTPEDEILTTDSSTSEDETLTAASSTPEDVILTTDGSTPDELPESHAGKADFESMLPFLDIVGSEETTTHYYSGPGANADGSVAYDLADLLLSGQWAGMDDINLYASTVPSGTADMRVAQFLNADGSENTDFAKSDGIGLYIVYSALWAGDNISTADATLSRGQYCYCIDPYNPLVRNEDQAAGAKTSGSFGLKDHIYNRTTALITGKRRIFTMLGRVLAICGPDTQKAQTIYTTPAEATKYLATQVIIWEIWEGDIDANFNLVSTAFRESQLIDTAHVWANDPPGGKSIKYWHDHYLTLLQNSKKIPSFTKGSLNVAPEYTMTSDTITLTDTLGLLQYMTFTPSDSSVSITRSGNTITIKNPKNVDFTVTTNNTICAGAKEPVPIMANRTLDNTPGQTTMIASTTNLDDPVNGYFKVKAINTTVEISKTDKTTGNALAGAKLQIKDASGNVVDSWTTTSTPHTVTGIAPGNYTLVETQAPTGYAIAAAKSFTVTNTTAVQKVEMVDDVIKVQISKTDKTTGNALAGAKLQLKDSAGKVVASWESTATPKYFEKLAAGTYTLVETQVPSGYATAQAISFTVTAIGTIQNVTMVDDVTKVQISKKDIVNGNELPGATLQIFDKDGNVVEEWVSTEDPHYIEKLPVGEYTLHEEITPDGFVTAHDVKFTVEDTVEIQKVEMIDDITKVEISKTDIVTGESVIGAELSIIPLDEDGMPKLGEVFETWITTDAPHYIEHLPVGDYILRERLQGAAWDFGYVTAADVKFKVEDTGEIQKVEMKDDFTKVEISKTDIVTGEPVIGAELSIIPLDEEGMPKLGEVFATWITTDKPHYIEHLPVGDYILREKLQGLAWDFGYVTAADVKFKVEDTGEIQKVEMKDDFTKVEISKTDIVTGEPVIGAELSIIPLDEEGMPKLGEVFETWITTDEPHYIEHLPVGDYILREKLQGLAWDNGYVTATDVKFRVEDTGEIQPVEMKDDFTKVEISKKDIVNGNELPDATLQIIDKDGEVVEEWVSTNEPHYIEHLPVGDYILREKIPADGFVTANDVEFTVEDTGEIQHVEMIDDVTKLQIIKIEATTGKPLSGATLQILDSKGNLVDEWITTSEPHYIEKLILGETYTLHEKATIEGYILADDTRFEMLDTDQLQTLEIKNQREGRVTITFNGKGVQTGDASNTLGYAVMGITAAVALTILTTEKKRRSHEEE